MIGTPDRQESDERNLHACDRSQRVPGSVADVQTRAVPPHADQDENMKWEYVGDEYITSPRCHHVAVEQSAERTPHY